MTDKASYNTIVGRELAEHGIVRHNKGEYGCGDTYSNVIGDYFKHGKKGVNQHCAKKHLHCYLAE